LTAVWANLFLEFDAKSSRLPVDILFFFVEFDAKRSRSRVLLVRARRASSNGRQTATPLLLLFRYVNARLRERKRTVSAVGSRGPKCHMITI